MTTEIKKIKRLFAALDDQAVRYCHWKSNQHIEAALAGTTDLDILVDGAQTDACRRVLLDFGCKQVVPQPSAQYPGIEDWLACDEESAALAHIHLHFRIVAGGKPKNYHLPIENWLLSGCARLYNLSIAAHAKELIVLIVRTALKTRYRDLARALLLPSTLLSPAVRAEFDWLLERVQAGTVNSCLHASGLPVEGSVLTEFLDRYASGRLTPSYLLGFKMKLTRALRGFKTTSELAAQRVRTALFFRTIFLRSPRRKTLRNHGVFFALVGADGSGKTTLARDLAAWLGWKLETKIIYFGIPKSKRAYGCLTKAAAVVDTLKKKARQRRLSMPAHLLDAGADVLNSLLWFYVAYRRLALSRQAKAYQKKGFVVIGERFPLKDLMSMAEPMDGPRLQNTSKPGLFSRLERFFYSGIEAPDCLFVLQAGAGVLHARKKNTPLQHLCAKADAVNNIRADATTIILDAEAPYEHVVRAFKIKVWGML